MCRRQNLRGRTAYASFRTHRTLYALYQSPNTGYRRLLKARRAACTGFSTVAGKQATNTKKLGIKLNDICRCVLSRCPSDVPACHTTAAGTGEVASKNAGSRRANGIGKPDLGRTPLETLSLYAPLALRQKRRIPASSVRLRCPFQWRSSCLDTSTDSALVDAGAKHVRRWHGRIVWGTGALSVQARRDRPTGNRDSTGSWKRSRY